MATPDRVLVVAPNWLGDAVMALPAVQALRAHWPNARLCVAARPSVGPVYRMVDGVDDVLLLEPRAGGLSALSRARHDAARIAADGADLAVLFPNSFLAAWSVSTAGVPERWGFDTDARGRWLTRRVPRPPRDGHQADYYLALVAGAGVPPAPRVAALRVPDDSVVAARGLLRDLSGGAYMVCAPGAAYGGAKQWPPERFAQLAAIAARERGLSLVLVGAGGDAMASLEVQRCLTALPGGTSVRVLDLVGRTDVPTLAAVFQDAQVVVANDSGAMHVATAVGAPVVAIFGPTKERQTSPLPFSLASPPARIAVHDVWCRPCMLRECPLGHMCLREITAAQVAAMLP